MQWFGNNITQQEITALQESATHRVRTKCLFENKTKYLSYIGGVGGMLNNQYIKGIAGKVKQGGACLTLSRLQMPLSCWVGNNSKGTFV